MVDCDNQRISWDYGNHNKSLIVGGYQNLWHFLGHFFSEDDWRKLGFQTNPIWVHHERFAIKIYHPVIGNQTRQWRIIHAQTVLTVKTSSIIEFPLPSGWFFLPINVHMSLGWWQKTSYLKHVVRMSMWDHSSKATTNQCLAAWYPRGFQDPVPSNVPKWTITGSF